MPLDRITLTIGLDLVPGTEIEHPREAEKQLQRLLDHALPHNHPGVMIESVPSSRSYPSPQWRNPLLDQVPFGD